MNVKQGNTYWGMVGSREVERRVNIIETRSSGTQYVNWTHIKKRRNARKMQLDGKKQV